MQSKKLQMLLAACSTALLLAACGGGGDAAPPKTPVSRVFVMGDSLADVGTFGFKFTVQKSGDPNGYPVYPQIVAQNYGIATQCPFYKYNGTTFVANPTPGCTNFAIGNGHIQNPASQGGAAGPQSVPLQLSTAAQVYGSTFTSSDLFIVDGGGNDFGDLVTAYLGAQANPAGYASFVGALNVSIAGAGSANAAATQYMQALADKYYNAIKVNLTDRGATHVAVLNMPDVTLTPSFAPAMAGVSQAAGGGANGAAAAAQFQLLARSWIVAFNDRLAADAAGNASIVIVPFYTDMRDQVANASTYGLTNATDPACVVALNISTTSGTCTDTALSAAPPAGLSANWWTTWALADNLHPTPFGHQLLAASVSRALARAGWL